MADNQFLASFLKARMALMNESGPSKKGDTVKEDKKVMSLSTIIEDCPPKAKVLEYLRMRIEELEEDDF